MGSCLAFLVMIMVLAAVMATNGASFGADFGKRIASRISATIMVSVLFGEWYVFQFLCGPSSQTSTVFAAALVGMILWSFYKAAFTNPGTSDSARWRTLAASSVNKDVESQETIQAAALTKSNTTAVGPSKKSSAVLADLRAEKKSRTLLEAQAALKGDSCSELITGGMTKKTAKASRPPKSWENAFEDTHCDKCNASRPERAHHCRTCGVCVLRMDHHCAMVGNCIGQNNLKYFVVLNFWQFLGCLVFLFIPEGPGAHVLGYGSVVVSPYLHMTKFAAVGWAVLVMLTSGRTFFATVVLAATNVTTIESLYEGKNPYALPTARDNLRHFFGPLDVRLLFPLEATGESLPVPKYGSA